MTARRAHALVTLGLAQQDWGPAYFDRFSHAEFEAGWRGAEPCPTEAEIDAAAAGYSEIREAALQAIFSIEKANPATHRGHVREFPMFMDAVLRQLHAKINALDAEIAVLANRSPAPLPSIPVTHLIAVVKAVDDAIKIERAKL